MPMGASGEGEVSTGLVDWIWKHLHKHVDEPSGLSHETLAAYGSRR